MLIIFRMTAILVLAVLMTLALLLGLRCLHLARQLPSGSLKELDEYRGSGYDRRRYASHLGYCHYVTKHAPIAYRWVCQTLHIYVCHPRDSSNHECYEAASHGLI